jgi:hypothetical protein
MACPFSLDLDSLGAGLADALGVVVGADVAFDNPSVRRSCKALIVRASSVVLPEPGEEITLRHRMPFPIKKSRFLRAHWSFRLNIFWFSDTFIITPAAVVYDSDKAQV